MIVNGTDRSIAAPLRINRRTLGEPLAMVDFPRSYSEVANSREMFP
jgi:hypothetical protein